MNANLSGSILDFLDPIAMQGNAEVHGLRFGQTDGVGSLALDARDLHRISPIRNFAEGQSSGMEGRQRADGWKPSVSNPKSPETTVADIGPGRVAENVLRVGRTLNHSCVRESCRASWWRWWPQDLACNKRHPRLERPA